MFKRITVIFCTALISSGIFALEIFAQDGMVQESEIRALKGEVRSLKWNIKESKYVYDKMNSFIIPQKKGTTLVHQENFSDLLFSTLNKSSKPVGMLPSSQFPLGILKQRNLYDKYTLIFSGCLQTNAQYWYGNKIEINDRNKNTTYKSGKTIHVSTASLYTTVNIDNYVTGILVLTGNEKTSLNIKNAFFIFGNLEKCPIYASIGRKSVDLGSFSGGGTSTASLMATLFRPNDTTNVSLAYHNKNLNTNISIFKTNDHKMNFSAAAFHSGNIYNCNYSVNIGYVYNMNITDQRVLENSKKNNILQVGSIDIDISLNSGIFSFRSGYAQTTNKYSETNDSYAGAWYLQSCISPSILDKITNFSVSYHGAYNTSRMPVALTGSIINGYKPSKTNVNRMVITSMRRSLLTNNILVGAEHVYMHMYNNQHTHAYTLSLSAYF